MKSRQVVGVYQLPLWQGLTIEEEHETRLLALDPGKTTGVAFFHPPGKLLIAGAVPIDHLHLVLDYFWAHFTWKDYVIERWFLYPGAAKNLTFSDMEGPEAIGVARLWGIQHELELDRIVAQHRRPFLPLVPREVSQEHVRDAVAIGLCALDRRDGQAPDLTSWRLVHCLTDDAGRAILRETNKAEEATDVR